MKQSKKDTTLNEKDALQDLLEAEKLLLSYYNAAVIEGSCKPFRKEIFKNYTSSAETQFTVFERADARARILRRSACGKQDDRAEEKRLFEGVKAVGRVK